jgi:hypothetical protein
MSLAADDKRPKTGRLVSEDDASLFFAEERADTDGELNHLRPDHLAAASSAAKPSPDPSPIRGSGFSLLQHPR